MVNHTGQSSSGHSPLSQIDSKIKKEFDQNRRILSLDEYLVLTAENPQTFIRGSAQYLCDLMDHLGDNVFTAQEKGYSRSAFKSIVGQQQVRTLLYRSLKAFSRQGINNKLILLHGPNGSSKSSIAHALMHAMERYSVTPQGAQYTFNWVFPVERYQKGAMGLSQYSNPQAKTDATSSYAHLTDEDILARIPCDMRDHPLLLIPLEHREAFVMDLLKSTTTPEKARAIWEQAPLYLRQGEACQRCKEIYEALLATSEGDVKKVYRHIQVERFYYSRRYRKGVVTIEPQMHVDAQYHQLTYNRSMGSLPASLQSLNLFSLSGDLIDANRGLVEYSDLLKRPVDSYKYLLVACETGSVNVGAAIASLDTVMIGSANELQLDAFKEYPDFTSFKGRIELIRVPYLLRVTEEAKIYDPELASLGAEKHVAPHTAWTVALWSVLTRLKKPNGINYPPGLSSIVSSLSPMDKAKLYDSGEIPNTLAPEDRKILRANIKRIQEEYNSIPYYEGRLGASAREMKSVIFSSAQNPEFACLSPLSILRELEEFVKRVTEYDFLKQDIKDGYHDAANFVNIVRKEYLEKIDREVRDCVGLYDSQQWEDFLKKYVQHMALVIKKEKIKNTITGKLEDPDFALIDELEKIVEAPSEPSSREQFRQNIISQVGAWSLDHPGEQVIYAKVFPEFWSRLEKHYYESQKSMLTKMHDALLQYGREQMGEPAAPGMSVASNTQQGEGSQLAQKTLHNLREKKGYCDYCAKEVITFLMQSKY